MQSCFIIAFKKSPEKKKETPCHRTKLYPTTEH